MAKPKAITWETIFQNDEICQLAIDLGIPKNRLLQLNPKDKILPIRSLKYFVHKAIYYKETAGVLFEWLSHDILVTEQTDTTQMILRTYTSQIIYELIGFAYEFLFKSLVSIEYKGFDKNHSIKNLYNALKDKKIKAIISESVKDFQWSGVDEFIQFIDNTLVVPHRRYFSYDFCHTLEDFIAHRFSQPYPIPNRDKVGIEPLLELFMKLYEPTEKKAERTYNSWMTFIRKLMEIYPERFEGLNQQWSK